MGNHQQVVWGCHTRYTLPDTSCLLLVQGDYAGAVAAFSAAIALEPQNADFFHNRGFSLRKMVGPAWSYVCV